MIKKCRPLERVEAVFFCLLGNVFPPSTVLSPTLMQLCADTPFAIRRSKTAVYFNV
jgi:hypothetical protein